MQLIVKRDPNRDDTFLFKLIKDELLPLALIRFPDTVFNNDEFLHRLSNGTTYVWKGRAGRIIGFVHLFLQDEKVWLDMIAVQRHQQGKGIGKKLVQHAIIVGKAFRLNEISLYVDKSNRKAIRFYKKLGFRSVQYHSHIYCYELTKSLS
jgi:ribosomal protein S18 acetylase RimI-like enzyme